MSQVVMAGELEDFDVPSVLQAVSLSRQYTVVSLWDRRKRKTGEICIKAGQLVDASTGSQSGKGAFQQIMSSGEHHSFRVERQDDPAGLERPVGQLASMLLEVPSPQSAPPPASGASRPPQPAAQASTRSPRIVPAVSQLNRTSGLAELTPSEACLASGTPPLQALLLAKLPSCEQAGIWQRSQSGLPAEGMARYLKQATEAQACLSQPQAQMPTSILETKDGILVTGSVGKQRAVLFCFAPGTPLGLARLAAARLSARLTDRR